MTEGVYGSPHREGGQRHIGIDNKVFAPIKSRRAYIGTFMENPCFYIRFVPIPCLKCNQMPFLFGSDAFPHHARLHPGLLVIIISLVVNDVEELELVDAARGGDNAQPVAELLLLEELLGAARKHRVSFPAFGALLHGPDGVSGGRTGT